MLFEAGFETWRRLTREASPESSTSLISPGHRADDGRQLPCLQRHVLSQQTDPLVRSSISYVPDRAFKFDSTHGARATVIWTTFDSAITVRKRRVQVTVRTTPYVATERLEPT